MKLAILGTRGIPARYGGFETFAEELSTRLVERGVQVTVYCASESNEAPRARQFKGVSLVYIPAPRLGPLTTIFYHLRCLWHARKDFDVVYLLGYQAGLFCLIPRLWGREVWLNMDGLQWARPLSLPTRLWFRLMEFAAMWTPDRVIADARAIHAHLRLRHSHLPPVSVIPYGAPVVEHAPDPHLLDAWQLEPGGYYLVVCRLQPENSVEEIIKGYLRSRSRFPLVIAGDTATPSPYVETVLRYRDERVRFIGTVYDKRRLQALRCHAFAYFHGHTVGGTNPSLLEAMGCGNVVIAAANRFNREVAGKEAIYFQDENDVTRLIRMVETLPVAVLEEKRKRARERVRDRYSWESVTSAYLDLLPRQADVLPIPLLYPVQPSYALGLYRKGGEGAPSSSRSRHTTDLALRRAKPKLYSSSRS